MLARELEAYAAAAGAGAPPHPGTATWAGQYGRTIPGSTCGEQLAAVRGWNESAWTRITTASRRALAFGVHTPSAIEEAVGCPAGKPQWRARLAATMAATFTDGKWVLLWLASRRAAPKPGNG